METLKSTFAVVKYVKMSSYKIRRVLNQIRNKSYLESLMILRLMPYKSCIPIWQLLYSASANAENNLKLNKLDLFIDKAYVNEGYKLKRNQPRAKGVSYKILKPTCHITISLKLKK